MNAKQVSGTPDTLRWFKSSYSGSGGGDCVEVAQTRDTVHVRDSKATSDTDAGVPMLQVSRSGWASLVAYVSK
jgi:Domain of unknown function (DUF397)